MSTCCPYAVVLSCCARLVSFRNNIHRLICFYFLKICLINIAFWNHREKLHVHHWELRINPLHLNINIHILHSALYTFFVVLTRRICLKIKSCFSCCSFPLFLWPSSLIQQCYSTVKKYVSHLYEFDKSVTYFREIEFWVENFWITWKVMQCLSAFLICQFPKNLNSFSLFMQFGF